MTRRSAITLAAAAFVLTAGVAGSAALMTPNSSVPGYTFETAVVTKGEIRRVISTSGTVKPRTTVQVGSELSGRVKAIVSDFNAKVKSGDLLAIIEPKTFQSRAKQAKADVMSAKASVASAESAVRKANSILENAKKVLTRQQALDRKGIGAGMALDTAERDVEVGHAELEVAQANLDSAKAVVAQRQAQLEQAMMDIDRTQIRAPIDGVVLHRSIEVGQTVAASFQAPELFRLAGDLSLIHIEAQVSEAEIGSVRVGQTVSFDVDAYPKVSFNGKVEQVRLSPSADDNVVTYTVIIEADNSEEKLFPGMTANVRIETDHRIDVARVPVEAIRYAPPRTMRAKDDRSSMWSHTKTFVRSTLGIEETKENSASEHGSPQSVEALMHRWSRRLALDDAQASALRSKLASAAGPDGKFASNIVKVEKLVAPLLRPDQKEALGRIVEERARTRRASVWVIARNGIPEKRSVRIGLADPKFVELTSQELKPGDRIVVRSRRVKAQ